MPLVALLLLSWLEAAAQVSGFAAIQSEPNLEKRSELALNYAFVLAADMRRYYEASERAKFEAALEQVRQAVDLAKESLERSGKNPRKSPKYFKRADLRTRDLSRRLDGLANLMSVNEREPVTALKKHVDEVNGALVRMVMGQR